MISMTNDNEEIKGLLNYRSIKDNTALEQTSQLNSRRKSQVKDHVTAKKGGLDLSRKPKAPKMSKAERKLEDYLLLVSDQITAQVGEIFGPAEAKLMDYINYQANKTQHAIKDGKITFSIKEYARDNGLKFTNGNEKYPKQKLRKLLSALTMFRLEFDGGDKNSRYKYPVSMMTPISEYDTSLHGKVEIGFSPTYQELITKRAFYTPMPMELFRLDPSHQAAAYAIARFLYHNKRTNFFNAAHGYGNRIKIETLLSHCKGAFPDIHATKYFSRQIYDPFMKAVGEDLVSFFTLSFIDGDGQPTMLTNPSRDDFLSSTLVITDWHGYPDDQLANLTDRRKKAISNNKRRKTIKTTN